MLTQADRRRCERLLAAEEASWFERRGLRLALGLTGALAALQALREVAGEPLGSLLLAGFAGFVGGLELARLLGGREQRILLDLYRAAREPAPPA
jgi:hypothetical protein